MLGNRTHVIKCAISIFYLLLLRIFAYFFPFLCCIVVSLRMAKLQL
jgi:hypothetical protein